MSKTTEVQLDEPIVRGDDRISMVKIRRPASGELRGLRLSEIAAFDVNAIIALIPRISQPTLTEAECQRLDVADLAKLTMVIDGFFAPQPKGTQESPTA